jgi:hypothetical protein
MFTTDIESINIVKEIELQMECQHFEKFSEYLFKQLENVKQAG